MTAHRRERAPIDADELRAMALAYVARYLTSQSKLTSYLRRKLRERGWAGDDEPPIAAMVQRCAELGFVDDASFATAKASSLSRRGFGRMRVRSALKMAGIADAVIAETPIPDEDEARQVAMIFARRKRIGAFATKEAGPDQRRKWMAALINAGHAPQLAREIAWQEPTKN